MAVTTTIEGRSNYWLALPPSFLRVTAIEEDDGFVIITVTLTDKLPTEVQP